MVRGKVSVAVTILIVIGVEEGRRLPQGLQLTPQCALGHALGISKEEALVYDLEGFTSVGS